jgi:hypothetical protein
MGQVRAVKAAPDIVEFITDLELLAIPPPYGGAIIKTGGRDSQRTLALYVGELKEIAAALRDKVLSAGERAQYRLRGDILAKLILAQEKLDREEKTKQPVLPPWFKR